VDTSEHLWGPPIGRNIFLIAAKDDATSSVFCRFYPTDSTMTNMDFIRRYIEVHGRPIEIYLDKASHFKVNPNIANPPKEKPLTVEDKEFKTQIERAMRELDIKMTHAHSPEGKGRIEREFGTLQGRLAKVLVYDKINTLDEANEYLEYFLPGHNKRFMVVPAQGFNVHRPKAGFDLDAILSIQHTRTVSNDHVVRFENTHYQLLVSDSGPNLRRKVVTVEKRINGTIKIRYGGKYYNYAIIKSK
jgi:hypothetical protein